MAFQVHYSKTILLLRKHISKTILVHKKHISKTILLLRKHIRKTIPEKLSVLIIFPHAFTNKIKKIIA